MKRFRLFLLGVVLVSSQMVLGDHHIAEKDLTETANSAGQFETLLTAAEAAGLTPALQGSESYTVFAPTDAAFSALPKGTVDNLLKPRNRDQLSRLLQFHIVKGKVASSALKDGLLIETLSGQTAMVSAAEQGFNIQTAKIIDADIEASNGVIHVIDRVIMPAASGTDWVAQIEQAIKVGAPLYNQGNAEATVAVYQLTMERLLADATLSSQDSKRLRKALRQASRSHNVQGNAWDLRYALDDVRTSLLGDTRMSMSTY